VCTVLLFILFTIVYELLLRVESGRTGTSIKGFTYLTIGINLIPMVNIMTWRYLKVSKRLFVIGTIYSLLHYVLIVIAVIFVRYSLG
jgi:hypothetical protein